MSANRFARNVAYVSDEGVSGPTAYAYMADLSEAIEASAKRTSPVDVELQQDWSNHASQRERSTKLHSHLAQCRKPL